MAAPHLLFLTLLTAFLSCNAALDPLFREILVNNSGCSVILSSVVIDDKDKSFLRKA